MRELRADIPNTARADAPPPVFLGYQQAWVSDTSALKVAEKSRRIGLTWAEAADDVLIAAAANGQNVYYIGYNKDMAIEFIEACGMWARVFSRAASEIEEGIWESEDEADKDIKTFTIKFPESGNRIVALSSRPANLRGKQGVVVIDEAAFHDQLGELLKAALALLIWGGKVRVISTHNGDANAFNELIQEIRAKKRRGSVHRTTFREAVDEGLYRRVCLRLGKGWKKADEDAWVDDVYNTYGDAAEEELDVIPAHGSGAFLSRALIEARMYEAPVVRLALKDEFTHWPERDRVREIEAWCEEHLKPLLAGLNQNLLHYFGEDFARNGDLTVLAPLELGQDLRRRAPFIVELRNVPFEQQRQIVFYILDRLPKFMFGAFDARGNGQYLAEVAMQKYGAARIEQVMLSPTWYRENMPQFKAAFEDDTLAIPRDADIREDLMTIKWNKGVAQLDDSRSGGKNAKRHGDAAIALVMAHFASMQDGGKIEFTPAPAKKTFWDGLVDDDDYEFVARSKHRWW